MKTAPPPRNRKSSPSRPRSSAPRTDRTASDAVGASAGRLPSGGRARAGSANDAAPNTVGAQPAAPAEPSAQPPEQVASAAVARHTAAARTERAPSAPPRAAFLRSFVYAWSGIAHTVRTQRNMRVHLALALLAVALGIWLRISPVEFAMIFVAITGVVVSEMMNTVAEACVDLATQEYHPLARVAKDVAAGAVLLSAMLAVVIACFVYIPHLWPLLLHLFGR